MQIHPKKIVTNNTGIAHAAYEIGIPWIAGPFLNIVNSYSLLTLKENFNCVGAFISNEINKIQISNIKKPKDFKLYYSIFHPIILMTSRQCLFHQVTGCEKNKIENTCIQNCEKSASITNLKGITSIIEKSKGNYHRVFNETHYLNPDIVKDITNTFSSFIIDLSNVKTDTKIDVEKSELIYHFENLINGNPASKKELEQMIHPTINIQYKKGI